jgi:hypothetical protein
MRYDKTLYVSGKVRVLNLNTFKTGFFVLNLKYLNKIK